MPELRECIAHYLILCGFLRHCAANGIELHLIGLWADATLKEPEFKKFNGMVYKLDAKSKVKRGSNNAQTSLWPVMWKESKKTPHPPSITTLKLAKVTYTHRAIILQLGALVFQLAYLTHTSVQIFTREVWEETVQSTHQKERGYRIGLAFEFQHHFITFLSLDQVFQPIWATSLTLLPPPPCDTYASYQHFLQMVAKWIVTRAQMPRKALACEVMRTDGNKVWGGVGVYTASEIFFDAGVSPFLTEAEVFDSPSRTARLCEALWNYAFKSHTELDSLLRPCIVDGILAPTTQQRLGYKKWLHIYAKDRVMLTPRMANLRDAYENKLLSVDDYFTRSDVFDLYDVFEPTLIRDALTSKKLNLGHLIFGFQQWKEFNPDWKFQPLSDPLTAMFLKRGLLSETSRTFLHCDSYKKLFDTGDPNKRPWRQSTVARGSNVSSRQIWSVTSLFPSYLVTNVDDDILDQNYPLLTEITGSKRKSMLFESIVQNKKNSVAIGPLEYCGNGTVVLTTHRKRVVSAVRASRQSILNKHSYSRSGSISDEDSEADSESELIPSETEFTHPFDYPHVASSSVSLALSDHSSLPSSPPPSSEASGTNSRLPSLEPDSSDEEPARKRQRRSHITSDRYIVQQGTDTNIQESSDLSTGRSQRVASIKVFYGRIKRKYIRKQ